MGGGGIRRAALSLRPKHGMARRLHGAVAASALVGFNNLCRRRACQLLHGSRRVLDGRLAHPVRD